MGTYSSGMMQDAELENAVERGLRIFLACQGEVG